MRKVEKWCTKMVYLNNEVVSVGKLRGGLYWLDVEKREECSNLSSIQKASNEIWLGYLNM